MPYVLMYQARSKQRWYWTIDQKFTSKKNCEFVIWESLTGLHHDFDNLRQAYPTRFRFKRPDSFFALDLQDRETLPLATIAENDPEAQETSARYVITVMRNSEMYYFRKSTKKFEQTDVKASVWQELAAPIELAQKMAKSKTIWAHNKKCDPETLRIFDLASDEFVWEPSKEDQVTEPSYVPLFQTIEKRITAHLQNSSRINTDAAIRHNMPTIDCDLCEMLAAAGILVQGLAKKTAVDRLLNTYEKSILQDFLHTIELTDLDQLDQSAFLAAFQASRLERRKIKDLSIFLTALAESFDVKKFLNILQSNPSYGNSYSFKDKETADKISNLIRTR